MEVIKVVKKPGEYESVLFSGGADSGNGIVSWVMSKGGTAVWLDEQGPISMANEGEVYPGRDEGVRVITPQGAETASVGDYVVYDPDQDIFFVNDEDVFRSKFTPVGSDV